MPCQRYSTGCTCDECEDRTTHEAQLRAKCTACNGDPQACLAADRIIGCAAFDNDGTLRALPRKKPAPQPWETRAA